MSNILLGGIALSDMKLDSSYSSDMENNMNRIEWNQIQQNFNRPEYLKQFDELSFDNIAKPTCESESFINSTGINQTLQRNLDFQRGYSQFQKLDMHYDVVTKENFTHNNMIPSVSRRDFPTSINRSDRKLETFTGISDTYTAKKEKLHLFKPTPNLSWVNGMPAVTDKLQNRYLASNKNNMGNLPFENKVRVIPGLDGVNQGGRYSVYRVNPLNVDNLRSEINQKVTYKNKPIETVKKGEFRGPDFNLTKYKLPDFRETKFGDLLPSKSQFDGPKSTGVFTNVDSQRGASDIYYTTPATNTTMGDVPNIDTSIYEESKKENYYNDISHSVSGVLIKPVMTNINSFNNYETQRASTNSTYEGMMNVNNMTYKVDYKDIPLTTFT
jgi:hypothetical protein